MQIIRIKIFLFSLNGALFAVLVHALTSFLRAIFPHHIALITVSSVPAKTIATTILLIHCHLFAQQYIQYITFSVVLHTTYSCSNALFGLTSSPFCAIMAVLKNCIAFDKAKDNTAIDLIIF